MTNTLAIPPVLLHNTMAYVNNPAAAAAAFVQPPTAAAAANPVVNNPQPQQAAASPAGGAHGAPNHHAAAAAAAAGGAANSLALLNMSNLFNQKDSRWLQLEVCREFQRNKCSRSDCECKFAHPPSNVEVQNGRVTACYDSIKGRCNREKPPCKYFHPPQHLKEQLLINGRNHLALKNALMQQVNYMSQPLLAGQFPSMNSGYVAFPHATPGYIPSPLQSPYFAAAAAANPLAHINPAIMFPTAVTSAVTEPQSVAMVNTTDSSRSVQMQAALLQQVQPGQFHAAAAQAAAQAQAAHHAGQPHHHPHLQLQQHQHHHHHGHQQKANKGDRAEGVPTAERNM